jgi:hypothetical protein
MGWHSLFVLGPQAAWIVRFFAEQLIPCASTEESSAHRLCASPELTLLHHRADKSRLSRAEMATFPARGHSASRPGPAAHSLSSASLEVSSPSAPSARRVLFTARGSTRPLRAGHDFAWVVTLPPSGFLTLWTVCSSSSFAGLFHPTSTHGVPSPLAHASIFGHAACCHTPHLRRVPPGRTGEGPPHECGVASAGLEPGVSTRCLETSHRG